MSESTTLSFVRQINNEMAKTDLIMIYTGDFSQDVTRKVLSMTERNFDAEGIDLMVRKKVFNVMMEALQNICKHQHLFRDSLDVPPIFTIGFDHEHYLIISGNVIANDKIEMVKSRIDKVNGLDREGLKSLYKEARLNSRISDVGGAGLGFIDMARKSENKLEYRFDQINHEASYFTLMVKVLNAEEKS